jgi:hypothetical protein
MRSAFPLLLLVAGCATVGQTDLGNGIVGPHGERVVQIKCQAAAECLQLARQTCNGDYDLVNESYEGAGVHSALVHCRNVENARGEPVSCTNDAQCGLDQSCVIGTGASGLCTGK